MFAIPIIESIWMDDDEEHRRPWQYTEDEFDDNATTDEWLTDFTVRQGKETPAAPLTDAPAALSRDDKVAMTVEEGEIRITTRVEGAREDLPLDPDVPFELQRERDHPFDRNAVAVYCRNEKLGYLPRELAEFVSPAIYDGLVFQCGARAGQQSGEPGITLVYTHGAEVNHALAHLPLYAVETWQADEESSICPLRSCSVRGRPLYLPFLRSGEEVYLLKDESIASDGVYVLDQYGYRLGHLPPAMEKSVSRQLRDGYRYPARIQEIKEAEYLLGNIRNYQIDIAIPARYLTMTEAELQLTPEK